MKKVIYKSIAVLIGITVLAGCDKYLEENPDNRVELNTPEKAAQLLTNSYSNAGYTFTEWMSDNVTFTRGTSKQLEHTQSYEWEDVTSINQDTPTNYWTATYDAIAHANEVLAVIDNLPGEQARKDAVKGEALLSRAYGHFMLVNLFGLHYDPQNADDDLGIPYVSEPETEFIKKYTRNTVEEVYDKVEADLLAGLDLVDGTYYANSGKYHFTRNAALALASRFYLFKGDYAKCIQYSSQMLGTDASVFMKDIALLLQQKVNPEDFIRLYTSPTDLSNLLMVRQITNFPVNVGFWPDSQLLFNSLYNNNPFGIDDVRTSVEYPIYVRGDNGLAMAKYEFLFERTSLTSNVGLYYTIMPVFRGEEVILNRAESYVRNNQISAALADLQVYVSKRYIGATITTQILRTYYGSTNDANNLLNFIITERRKEFMHEGLRWFDIKRLKIAVQHVQADGSTQQLSATDDRKVLQIPQAAIDIGGLEENPR
jgi:hypothetical protein